MPWSESPPSVFFCVFSGLSALIWPPSSTALLGTGGVRAGVSGWPAVWLVSVPTSRARLFESCEQSYLHTLWAPHILFGGPACAPAHCTGYMRRRVPYESTWTTFLQKGGTELCARDACPSWLWQTYSIVQAVQNKHMYVWAAPISSTA